MPDAYRAWEVKLKTTCQQLQANVMRRLALLDQEEKAAAEAAAAPVPPSKGRSRQKPTPSTFVQAVANKMAYQAKRSKNSSHVDAQCFCMFQLPPL